MRKDYRILVPRVISCWLQLRSIPCETVIPKPDNINIIRFAFFSNNVRQFLFLVFRANSPHIDIEIPHQNRITHFLMSHLNVENDLKFQVPYQMLTTELISLFQSYYYLSEGGVRTRWERGSGIIHWSVIWGFFVINELLVCNIVMVETFDKCFYRIQAGSFWDCEFLRGFYDRLFKFLNSIIMNTKFLVSEYTGPS